MRYLLFNFFVRAASLFSVDKEWMNKQLHTEKQLKTCRLRQEEMNSCIRPRTYPKVSGDCKYTDFFDSSENWRNKK